MNNDNEMKQIKNLGIVIPLFILILGLIIARSTNKNLFKKEAQLALKEAVNNSISMDQLKQSTSDYTIIGLDGPVELENSRVILFGDLLSKENRNMIEELEGDLILYSADVSLSSKAWVILNQLGYSRVFILQQNENEELLKYKFQPDTSVRLE